MLDGMVEGGVVWSLENTIEIGEVHESMDEGRVSG